MFQISFLLHYVCLLSFKNTVEVIILIEMLFSGSSLVGAKNKWLIFGETNYFLLAELFLVLLNIGLLNITSMDFDLTLLVYFVEEQMVLHLVLLHLLGYVI